MKDFLIKVKNVILYIWQLPQNLLGLLLITIYKKKVYPSKKIKQVVKKLREKYNLTIFIADTESLNRHKILRWFSGFSIGKYIYLPENAVDSEIFHEAGHTIQSKILGPLYLIIVGISSAVFCNLWDRIFHREWTATKRREWYYSRFPEKWADDLGAKRITFND